MRTRSAEAPTAVDTAAAVAHTHTAAELVAVATGADDALELGLATPLADGGTQLAPPLAAPHMCTVGQLGSQGKRRYIEAAVASK